MAGRYGVVLTYRGSLSRPDVAGRFKRLDAAVKERDRQAERAWFRVESAADLLKRGNFHYRWRVWDCLSRKFAD